MQHREESRLNTPTPRIAGDGEQRLGGDAEEDLIEDLFVIEGDGGDGLGDGEDQVEVLHRQQLALALLDPLGARQALALGTVAVAAGAVLNVGALAVVTPFDDTAQRGRAAVFDGPHQTPLMQGHGMRLPVSWAVPSKDVGQLQDWPGHRGLG